MSGNGDELARPDWNENGTKGLISGLHSSVSGSDDAGWRVHDAFSDGDARRAFANARSVAMKRASIGAISLPGSTLP